MNSSSNYCSSSSSSFIVDYNNSNNSNSLLFDDSLIIDEDFIDEFPLDSLEDNNNNNEDNETPPLLSLSSTPSLINENDNNTSEPSEPPPPDDYQEDFEDDYFNSLPSSSSMTINTNPTTTMTTSSPSSFINNNNSNENNNNNNNNNNNDIETNIPFSNNNLKLNDKISRNNLKSSSALSHLLSNKLNITNNKKETCLLGDDNTLENNDKNDKNDKNEQLESKLSTDEPMILLQDHPEYSKYLRMLKVGLPIHVIKDKIQREGYDPKYIDCSGDTLIPLNKPSKLSVSNIQKEKNKLPTRKKRIQWIEIKKDQITENSIWWKSQYNDNSDNSDNENIFDIDNDELIRLFIPSSTNGTLTNGKTTSKSSSSNPTLLTVLDPKRCRNACIALARIRVPFEEIRRRIGIFDYQAFTVDQISILLEYLPTSSELSLLQTQITTPTLLSNYQLSDRYMYVMSALPQIHSYLEIMKYIHISTQHVPIVKSSLILFQQICSEFLECTNLKLFLHFLLQIGNTLNSALNENSGGKQSNENNIINTLGFRCCESLLKLKMIKANAVDKNDNKSIKNQNLIFYIIKTLKKKSKPLYNFFYDMKLFYDVFVKNKNLNNLNFENLMKDFLEIKNEINEVKKKYSKIIDDSNDNTQSIGVDSLAGRSKVESYFEKMKEECDEIEVLITNGKEIYHRVLQYFGEDINLPSGEFFSIFQQFIEEIIVETNLVEKHEASLAQAANSISISVSSPKTTSNDLTSTRRRRNSSIL